jgi:Flp pilus assembly protein TadG
MLVLGSIEFGRVLMIGQMATNAARAGCRQGTLSGSTTDTITTAVDNALTGGGITGGTVTVKVNDVVADASTATTGDKITVQVSVPLAQNQWLNTAMFVLSGSAQSTAVMCHE